MTANPDILKLKQKPTKKRLNKRTLAALTPPPEVNGKPQQAWTYDTQTPRLSICCWSSGTRIWYWVGRFNGRMIRYKLGGYPELSPENARKLASQTSAKVAQGIDPRRERQEARQEPTFKTLFEQYMEGHAKLHKKTWAADQAQFDRYLKSWGNKRVSEITEAVVRAKHAKVGKENGTYAANRLLSLVSAVFNFGKKPNPAKGIRKYKEQSRDRFLQADELGRFFAALDQESPAMADYFRLALFVGARRGNTQSMRWDQLHLDRGEWRIPDTKAGKPQTTYLPPEAVEILKRRKETSKSEWVFPSRRGSKLPHLSYQYKSWASICERAGLKGLRPHDLRRSLGSWQAASGASLLVIGKSLGHRNPSTTAIYARLNLDPVKASVDLAVKAMMEASKQGQGGSDNEVR